MIAIKQEPSIKLRNKINELYYSDVMSIELREHATRVGWYSYILARQHGLSDHISRNIMIGAMLHDIGKSLVPDHIEHKPSRLTPEEFEIMKRHCEDGVAIANDAGVIDIDTDFGEMIKCIILNHHENFDGTGYPNQVKGSYVPIEANLVSLADVFDALMYERVYKKAWEEDRVVCYLNENSRKMFHPSVVETFNEVRHALVTMKRYFNEHGTPTEDPFTHHTLITKAMVHENIYLPF